MWLGIIFIDHRVVFSHMPIVEFDCPHDGCEATARINFINLEVLKSDSKTITCGSCKGSIKFEYCISPLTRTKKYRDHDWLQKEYVEKNKTMSEIAVLCNTSAMTIHHWIKKHGIEARDRGTRKSL